MYSRIYFTAAKMVCFRRNRIYEMAKNHVFGLGRYQGAFYEKLEFRKYF